MGGLTFQAGLEIIFLSLMTVFPSHPCSEQATLTRENLLRPKEPDEQFQPPPELPKQLPRAGQPLTGAQETCRSRRLLAAGGGERLFARDPAARRAPTCRAVVPSRLASSRPASPHGGGPPLPARPAHKAAAPFRSRRYF